MLNFGFGEMLIVLVLAIVVVGPDRLPEMLRFLGKQYGKLLRSSDELRRAFMMEADMQRTDHRAESLRKRREETKRRLQNARDEAIEQTNTSPHTQERLNDEPDLFPKKESKVSPQSADQAVTAPLKPVTSNADQNQDDPE